MCPHVHVLGGMGAAGRPAAHRWTPGGRETINETSKSKQQLRSLLQVHVLGRMGAAGRALQLIIGRLADVPAAIAFVQSQADDELWQHLIQLALQDPESTGLAVTASVHEFCTDKVL